MYALVLFSVTEYYCVSLSITVSHNSVTVYHWVSLCHFIVVTEYHWVGSSDWDTELKCDGNQVAVGSCSVGGGFGH